MSEFRNTRTSDRTSIDCTKSSSAFASGDELTRNLSIGEKRELEQLFNPKGTSKGSLPEEFFVRQGLVGQPATPRYGQQYEKLDSKGLISEAALKAAKKDPLLASVIKVLDAKGGKEGQSEADQVVKALIKKHGKNSKEVAQVLSELGAVFQSKKHIDIAKGFYVQGVDIAKAALGKEGEKSVLLADLYGGLATVQTSKGDWKGTVESSRQAAKIFSKIFETVPNAAGVSDRIDKLGPEFMEKMKDNYLVGYIGCKASGQKEAAVSALRGFIGVSTQLDNWRAYKKGVEEGKKMGEKINKSER
jgi:hypothetical protein